MSRPQGHSAIGRIKSIEISSVLIGNRTIDLPACNMVPQATTLPRAPRRQQVPPKKLESANRLHCVTSQKTVVLILTATATCLVDMQITVHCHIFKFSVARIINQLKPVVSEVQGVGCE
jgi:hypothetical protein